MKTCVQPRIWIVLAIMSAAATGALAKAEKNDSMGNAQSGRQVALISCTGCHIVASDQPFKPIYPEKLPDFETIANKPNTTAASLRHFLETLPAVPKRSQMGNPLLSSEDLRDVVAYVLSLRQVSSHESSRERTRQR
jgi:mono/diheme cytochrome c family protein